MHVLAGGRSLPCQDVVESPRDVQSAIVDQLQRLRNAAARRGEDPFGVRTGEIEPEMRKCLAQGLCIQRLQPQRQATRTDGRQEFFPAHG